MYCRKSMESEDRQALSIPAQISEIEKLAERIGLPTPLPCIQESKSAMKPGMREGFNELLHKIESGTEYTVLVWSPDRLSRNPVDAGQLINLMDTGKLVEIITPSQTFKNNPMDKFMLGFFMNQAKFENDKKGVDVKRGLKAKAEMGWYPTHAPTGYLNPEVGRKGYRIVEVDPLRFPLMRRAMDEILNGKQASEVWKEAREVWKLTTPSGRPISVSAFYNMLNNPFYYGEFEWTRGSGNWYKGKHRPMITKEEFDLIQKMLGHAGKPVARSHTFDLTGLFQCKYCKCSITGTKKTKFYKQTKRIASYIYYHCTRKHREISCTMPPITETTANEQLTQQLSTLKPPQDFIDWAKRWVHVVTGRESSDQNKISQSQQQAGEVVTRKLDRLLEMRLNEEITESTYKHKQKELDIQLGEIEQVIKQKSNPKKEIEEINNALEYAETAATRYTQGKREDKHFILLKVGSNLWLDRNRIWIDLKPEYLALNDSNSWEDRYSVTLEPQKYSDTLIKYPDLVPANPVWLPG